jgi:NitT/TauT family transport system substrate-binding protein
MRRSGASKIVLALGMGALLAAVACSGEDAATRAASGKVAIALNWKPEPEFGGLYEAQRADAFTKRGLSLEITGGPGAPVVQMVEAGKVEFGIAAADEVMLARDRGTDIVAVFATYQTNPQGIMVHASRGLQSLPDLFAAGGTLAVEPGVAYTKFFEKHFDLAKMKIVPYGYSIAPFLNDKEMAQQVFVTAEPIAARRQGADPQVFLIAESGFNPYAAVVVTTGARARGESRRVADFVAALREGWRGYLEDPTQANALMGALNKEMDGETFRLAAEAQKPLIEDASAKQHGIGAMSLERWTQLGEQLRELGLIGQAVKPQQCFVDADASSGAPVESR